MWTVATYNPTTLFSLRPALSTSSGGQTLVVPTPYALKMALLDAAIRCWGLEQGMVWFPALRDLQVAVEGPKRLVVNNMFIKIQRLRKNGPSMEMQDMGIVAPMQATIAFRSFVQFAGPIRIALSPGEEKPKEAVTGKRKVHEAPIAAPPIGALMAQVNYMGKRGGFFQLAGVPTEMKDLPEYPSVDDDNRMAGFVRLNGPQSDTFPLEGLMQVLDDCASHLSFAKVDIYSGQSMQVGKDRVLRHVTLPYRQVRSSHRYQVYERI